MTQRGQSLVEVDFITDLQFDLSVTIMMSICRKDTEVFAVSTLHFLIKAVETGIDFGFVSDEALAVQSRQLGDSQFVTDSGLCLWTDVLHVLNFPNHGLGSSFRIFFFCKPLAVFSYDPVARIGQKKIMSLWFISKYTTNGRHKRKKETNYCLIYQAERGKLVVE